MIEVNTKTIGDPGSRKVFGAWLAYEGLLKGIATFIGSEILMQLMRRHLLLNYRENEKGEKRERGMARP